MDQFCGAAGGFQRNAPTGGAAYGMPRNFRPSDVTVPDTRPFSIVTTWPFVPPAPWVSACASARVAASHSALKLDNNTTPRLVQRLLRVMVGSILVALPNYRGVRLTGFASIDCLI